MSMDGGFDHEPQGNILALQCLAHRDPRGLDSLYRQYSDLAAMIARDILCDADDVEEVVQDVFIAVWRHASRFDARRGTVAAWIATIARTRAIDRWRRRHVRERAQARLMQTIADTGRDETWSAVSAAESHKLLRQLLATLPPTQQLPIELAFFEGYTHDALAHHLDWPLGTVKGRIRDGLRKLRGTCATHGCAR
jgi:RNA polymerase sigma-70 factor (ECF subfamily)